MSILSELSRRNVIRTGLAYVVASWLLLQISDVLSGILDLSDSFGRGLFVILVLGFLPAVLFSWAFEVTPDGIRRDDGKPGSSEGQHRIARRLDSMLIVMLVAVASLVLYDRIFPAATMPPLSATIADGAVPATRSQILKNTELDDEISIAILPFTNMSADDDNEYFSDGISEEILNVLSDVDGLRVAARTSSFSYKESSNRVSEIADQLGVTYVLEGSVRRFDDSVRISAQLVKADEGYQLWSESFDREMTNIFVIQDEIAANVVNTLKLSFGDRVSSYTRVVDLDPEVYEDFLKARFLLRRRNPADLEVSIKLLESIVLDQPRFADGLALLAEGLTQQLNSSVIRGEQYSPEQRLRVEELVNRALSLDPESSLAHLVGAFLSIRGDNALEIVSKMQRAAELDTEEPRAQHWLALRYQMAGYIERAEQAARRAVTLGPDNANAHAALGTALLLQGDFSNAESHFRDQIRLGNPGGALNLFRTAYLAGDLDQAKQLLVVLPWGAPNDRVGCERFLSALASGADTQEFLAWVRDDPSRNHFTLELLALGFYAETYDLIDSIPVWVWSEFFSEARAVPAFAERLERSGLYELWNEQGMPSACRKSGNGYDCGPEEMTPTLIE
ncbi:MAG: hypothetical protein AAGA44_06230 [Pseudomonadota bacterium]